MRLSEGLRAEVLGVFEFLFSTLFASLAQIEAPWSVARGVLPRG